ncbi:MAG: LTA synthase family protein [Gammaproteobacteria bacterium]|nr:LTA synthase family protein [Gammaproteobacteria bacterium]
MSAQSDPFWHSRRLRFLFFLTLFHFAAFLLFRLGFLISFWPSDSISVATTVQAFYLGAKFDLRLALLLSLPLLLLAALPRLNLLCRSGFKNLVSVYLLLSWGFVSLAYFLDFGHYAYLSERLNASVLRFADNAEISADMLWQSYPMVKITLLWLVLWVLYGFVVEKITRPLSEKEAGATGWRAKVSAALLVFLLTFAGLYGKASWYPLRWSDAFMGNNAFASALALNPVLFYFDTLKYEVEQPYDEAQARRAYPLMAKYLGLPTLTATTPLNYARQIVSKRHNSTLKKPNIIYVLVESLGANQLGLFGNTLNATPNLDRLAGEGLFFDRFYVPVGGTARSVFALLTGIPDVSPVRTASRNPMIVDQQMVFDQFKDYEKYYFIGGSASWGNVRGLLHNINELNLYEEGSYTAPKNDVWGISDLDLFREASAVFSQHDRDKPFVAVIQTAGNHPPFTIPEDNLSFEIKALPEDKKQWQGFPLQGRYNGVRLVDHFIGELIKLGEQAGYGENTIYVFHGDHGITSSPSPHMGKAYDALNLFTYHTPLIIYAPNYVQPRRISQVTSELDVFPTLAGLAGLSYKNTTLGRDALQRNENADSLAFLYGFNSRLGVVSERFISATDFRAEQNKTYLYDLQSETPARDVAVEFPDEAQRLAEYGRAFYETARYMLYFNGAKSGEP